MRIRTSALAPCVVALLACGPSLAQPPAGEVLWVAGKVERIASDGTVEPLSQGKVVHRHDTIRTAPGSHAQLAMADEALVALRPDTVVRIDEYRLAAAGDEGRALFALLKGGLRSITGLIGREDKSRYRLSTPTASIGIRGTDHETFVAEAGTYNRVTAGGTSLQGAQGRLDLEPGQVGFAAARPSGAPYRMNRTPEFMHVSAMRPGRLVGPAVRDTVRDPMGEVAPKDHDRPQADPGKAGKQPPGNGAVRARLPSQAIGDNASVDRGGKPYKERKLRGWERFGKIKKVKP